MLKIRRNSSCWHVLLNNVYIGHGMTKLEALTDAIVGIYNKQEELSKALKTIMQWSKDEEERLDDE